MPNGADEAGAVLAPGGRDDALLGLGPLRAEEHVRLVELVDESERQQQQAAAQRQVVVDQVIDVGELDEDLVAVLDLDLRVEEELVVESVAGIEHGAQEIEPRRRRAAGARLRSRCVKFSRSISP